MRGAAFSLFLFAASTGFGQPLPKALLWRVSGGPSASQSYLLGTVHSRDARAFTDVPRVLAVMDSCTAVVGELDMTRMEGQMATLGLGMMMPPGHELSQFYTKRQHKKVKDALAEALGPVAMMMGRLKPFYLMALLSDAAMATDSAVVLDQYLQQKAQARGIAVLGLETVQEQLDAVNSLPLQEQANMLYDLVAHDLQRKEMDRMMTAYAAADLDALARVAEECSADEGFNARLLLDRNKVMAQRMDSLIRGGGTFLFMVGAAHLPNVTGVIADLRTRGYSVEPMLNAAPARKPEEH